MTENLISLIHPELVALIPLLYLIGVWLKKAKGLADYNIPLALTLIGIGFAAIWVLGNAPLSDRQEVASAALASIAQGYLLASAAVNGNQFIRQARNAGKDDKE